MAVQNDNWLGQNVAGRFHILKPLKEGGMAYLYLAQELRSRTTVVLKTPKLSLAADKEFLRRFTREIKVLRALKHPNIVPILDSGEHQGLPFFVLKYLPNGTLRDRLPVDENGRRQPVWFDQLVTWLGPIADALDYIHGKNLLHRDVKPDNILFDADDTPRLIDFGILKMAADAPTGSEFATQYTQGGMSVGTPQYMAPELIAPDLMKGRRVNGRSDQYSLGITLYELIAGQPPIADTNPAQVLVKLMQRKYKPLGEVVRGLSPELTHAVAKATATDPNKRFLSCRDFANAVMKATELQARAANVPTGRSRATQPHPNASRETRTPMPEVELVQQPSRPSGRLALVLIGLLVLLVSLLGLGISGGVAIVFMGVFSNPTTTAVASAPTTPAVTKPAVNDTPVDLTPRIALAFHDEELKIQLGEGGVKPMEGVVRKSKDGFWKPSMRFGLVAEESAMAGGLKKKLTFEPQGFTNNTVVKLDQGEYFFGDRPFLDADRNDLDLGKPEAWPGRWRDMKKALGKDAKGRERLGCRSEWYYDNEKVSVTQTVEIVLGPLSNQLDTCLVRYRLTNEDLDKHQVGIRFLLDTFVGTSDSAPFLIPGQSALCDTYLSLKTGDAVPDFLQAREFEDLTNPGTIAHIGLKGAGLEQPGGVALGAWPNPELQHLDKRCLQEKTGWSVPVLSMKQLTPPDSCVVMYWDPKELQPFESREVGFTYGLGKVWNSDGEGWLALTCGGSFTPGGSFTVVAYVSNPAGGETVTLTLPTGLELLGTTATQSVVLPPIGSSSRNSVVTWKVRASQSAGVYTLRATTSRGDVQTMSVQIKPGERFEK
jgi:serine/threonine protein kinase